MVVAHPFRRRDPNSLWTRLNAQSLAAGAPLAEIDWLLGLAAVEVLNGANEPAENAEAAALARTLGLPACGGSDAHWTQRVGRTATWFPGRITDDAGLVAALRWGGCLPMDRSNGRSRSKA